jgi:hypothetical protein
MTFNKKKNYASEIDLYRFHVNLSEICFLIKISEKIYNFLSCANKIIIYLFSQRKIIILCLFFPINYSFDIYFI